MCTNKRGFSMLVKYICYGILISCIPLMIFGFYSIDNEKKTIRLNSEKRFEAMSRTAANTFFNFIQSMQSVAISMSNEPRLQDSNLGTSVYGDLQVIQLLSGYRKLTPCVSSCGFYTTALPDTVYYSNGVWKTDVFKKYIVKDTSLIESIWEAKDNINFSGWSEKEKLCLCSIPISFDDNAKPRRMFLFLISTPSITNALSTVFAGQTDFSVVSVWDPEGKVIYFNPANEETHNAITKLNTSNQSQFEHNGVYYFSSRYSGYTVMIAVTQNMYIEHMEAFSRSIASVLALNVLLCILLAVMFGYLNYRPLSNLMRIMGIKPKSVYGEEFLTLQNTYINNTNLLYQLQISNSQSLEQIQYQVLEKLFCGIRLHSTDEDIIKNLLGSDSYYYFVVVAQKDKEQRYLSKYQSPEGIIWSMNMATDGYLVFICKTTNKNHYSRIVNFISNSYDTAVGVGSINFGWQHLHKSYMESIIAYRLHHDSNVFVNYYKNLVDGNDYSPEENKALNTIKIARKVKNGDAESINDINDLFDAIVTGSSSTPERKKFECYRLVDGLNIAFTKNDLPFDDEIAADILSMGSAEAIRKSCCKYVSELIDKIRSINYEIDEEKKRQLIRYIDDKLSDSMLNISMISDELDIPEDKVNLLLKESTGMKPQEYIRIRRIESAKDMLLETSDTVNKIAEDVGFSSCSYFIRIFKQSEGITPSAYRQMHESKVIISDN